MNVQEQGLAHIHPSHHLHPQPPPDAQGVGVHQPQHPPHLPQHMHHQTFPPMHHQLPQQLHPMQQIHHHQLGMPSHHVPNMYAEAKEIRTDGLMEEEQLTQLEDVDADLLNPFNFNLGQYVVSEDSIEPQLVDLLSMVLTMQTTMIEVIGCSCIALFVRHPQRYAFSVVFVCLCVLQWRRQCLSPSCCVRHQCVMRV